MATIEDAVFGGKKRVRAKLLRKLVEENIGMETRVEGLIRGTDVGMWSAYSFLERLFSNQELKQLGIVKTEKKYGAKLYTITEDQYIVPALRYLFEAIDRARRKYKSVETIP